MYGLTSNTGVPSIASRPLTRTVRPSTSVKLAGGHADAVRAGFGALSEDADHGPVGAISGMAGAEVDRGLLDLVEHEDDVDVGEVGEPREHVGAEAVGVELDRCLDRTPVVVVGDASTTSHVRNGHHRERVHRHTLVAPAGPGTIRRINP
jgi:hypothetical protein